MGRRELHEQGRSRSCAGRGRRRARGVPGVVAMVDRPGPQLYEGAAGERVVGRRQPMTTDTVFAIFSTTKAITGTAVLQLVEEDKLDLDAPASRYAPDIGKLQVIEGFDEAGRAEAARAEAPDHDPDADAAHGRLRLRLLQRDLQPASAGERPAERHHRDQGRADDAAAVRPRRQMGVRLEHRLVRAGGRGDHRQAARRGAADPGVRAPGHHGHDLRAERPAARAGSPGCTRATPTARSHRWRSSCPPRPRCTWAGTASTAPSATT